MSSMKDLRQRAEVAMAEYGLIWLEPPYWHVDGSAQPTTGYDLMISGQLGSPYTGESTWIGPFYSENMFWEVAYRAVMLVEGHVDLAMSA